MTIVRHIVRFVVAAIVLLIVAWLIPEFRLVGFWNAFLAALVIAAIGWIIEMVLGERISPYSRGFIGFLVSAVVIYFSQFFIANFQATFLGALIAAALIGIVDLFVPIKPRFGSREEIKER